MDRCIQRVIKIKGCDIMSGILSLIIGIAIMIVEIFMIVMLTVMLILLYDGEW